MERVQLKTNGSAQGTKKGPDRGSVRASTATRRIGAGATIKPKKEVSEEFEEQRGRGRPPGAKNKISGQAREDIMTAMADVGENGRGRGGRVGWLRRLARREPKAFAALYARLIPLDVQHGGDLPAQEHVHRHFHTINDLRAALKERGLNVDEIYEKPMKVIEHRKDELKMEQRPMSSVQKAMIGRG